MRGFTTPTLPEEESILYGEDGNHPLTILQAYLFNLLRRSMDRQSGIAGLHSVISWGGLYERAYEHSRQGFAGTGDAWGKSREDRVNYIRNQVRRIEKRGLVRLVTQTGGTLQVEFIIFNQFKSIYFNYDQNKLTTILPPQSTIILPPNSPSVINGLGCDHVANVTSDLSPKLTTSPKDPNITTATTVGDAENFMAQDPIANAMIQGGMQEYHVFMGLPLITSWRKLKGFAEPAAIALIKNRLAKNPSINSVSYFQGAIEQMCDAVLNPKVTPFRDPKPVSEFTLPRLDDDLPKWAKQHGYPDAQAGMSIQGYRRLLSDAIERRKRGETIPASIPANVGTASTSSMPSKRVAFPQSISELISQL